MICMGIFNKLFGNKNQSAVDVHNYFQSLTAYTPAFTTFEGGLYEMELVRAAIHSFASACGKLKPEIEGSAYKNLEKTLQYMPSPWMNTYQFIYRIATILSVNNNAFIAPIENEYGAITGYFPLLPESCEVIEVSGTAYLRYTFANGKRAAIELDKVGIVTQFQYRDDFFGTDNAALKPTMQIIHAQNQGIVNAIKNSAIIRFLAKIGRTVKPNDLKEAQETFIADNLNIENNGGVMFYDGKIDDVKPIESKPLNINPNQVKQIQENVFNYFGVNEDILQNKFNEDQWNAFYQGKIEPFAIQLSMAMTNMTFTRHELAFDNKIIFAMNHLQYASNSTRLNMATSFFDRGLMSRNMIMDMWNLPHVEGGDKFYIRKEYSQIDKLHDDPADKTQEEEETTSAED